MAQFQVTVDVDQAIIEETNKDLAKTVEEMRGLQQAMGEIAQLTNQQQEQLNVVEKNTEVANVNVEEGTKDVEIAHDYQGRNYKLIAAIVAVVVIVILVVVLGAVGGTVGFH